MLLKTSFEIMETPTPITAPVTKFGGQPVWLHSPHWPLCPITGDPMLFQSQIALDPVLFPGGAGIMAYIFYADEEQLTESDFAVVLQTKDQKALNTQSQAIEFVSQATGPAVYEWLEIEGEDIKVKKAYQVRLGPVEKETALPWRERYNSGLGGADVLDLETGYRFAQPALAGNKIGGQPFYVGYLATPPEYFTSDDWLQLLQLAPTEGYWDQHQPNFYPFYMEMGEFGLFNVFLSKDYQRAEVYVQGP